MALRHLTSVRHSLLWKYKPSNWSHSIRTFMTQSKASPKNQTHPCIGHYWACPVTELGVGYTGTIIRTDNTHSHTQREWSSLSNVLPLFCFVLRCFLNTQITQLLKKLNEYKAPVCGTSQIQSPFTVTFFYVKIWCGHHDDKDRPEWTLEGSP